MTREEAKAAVDKELNELALIMYGQPYDALNLLSQDKVIAESLSRFDPRLIDLADMTE